MIAPPDEITFALKSPPDRRRSGTQPCSRQTIGPPLARITRLMALAIRLDDLLRNRADLDCAALAKAGSISRTRLSQILNLVHLAPDIQEQLLWLPATTKGRDAITEKQIRRLAGLHNWQQQLQAFERLRVTVNAKVAAVAKAAAVATCGGTSGRPEAVA